MHMFDAEKQVMADLKEEGEVVATKQYPAFQVVVVRHPTLGKLVLVEDRDGKGAVVEVER